MKPDRFIHIRARYTASMPVDGEFVTNVTKPENALVTDFETKTSTNSKAFELITTVTNVTRQNIQSPKNGTACTLLFRRSFAKQDGGTPKSEDTENKKCAHHPFLGEHSKIEVTPVTPVTSEKPSENKGLLGGEPVTSPKKHLVTPVTNVAPEGGDAAERIARLDAERNERDRLAKRGYDYDGYGDLSYQFESGETVMRVFAHNRRVHKAAPGLRNGQLELNAALGLTQLREAEIDRLAAMDADDENEINAAASPRRPSSTLTNRRLERSDKKISVGRGTARQPNHARNNQR